ncbi:MAG: T9SS type A sorting domain-containing protein [Chitinophagales bacterium]
MGYVADKYVGLRFKVDGNDHYGWARLDVSHTKITLKDFAYNDVANEPISGLQSGIEFASADFNPTIYAFQEEIFIQLPNHVLNAEVSIFDLSGKLVLNESINQNASISMNNFVTGMYLVKIRNEETYFTKMISLK